MLFLLRVVVAGLSGVLAQALCTAMPAVACQARLDAISSRPTHRSGSSWGFSWTFSNTLSRHTALPHLHHHEQVHNLNAVKQQLWALDMEAPCAVGDAVEAPDGMKLGKVTSYIDTPSGAQKYWLIRGRVV